MLSVIPKIVFYVFLLYICSTKIAVALCAVLTDYDKNSSGKKGETKRSKLFQTGALLCHSNFLFFK